MSTASNKTTLPYLQIARGFAALFIVFNHTSQSAIYYWKFHALSGFFETGWCGVDFFFVLSGFIIYYIHARDLGQKAKWKDYMYKRVTRIYPVYWVAALLALILLKAAAGSGQLHRSEYVDAFQSPSYFLKSFLLFPQKRFPFLTVSWSLCYEMYFYLVFGLGILIDKRLLWLLPLVYLVINIWRIFDARIFDNFAVYFLGNNNQLEFMFGIATAWFYLSAQDREKKGMSPHPILRWLWIPGVLVFLCTWYACSTLPATFGKMSYPTKFSFGIAAAVIIFSIAHWKQLAGTVVNRFFLLLGDASYSLYLINILVVAVLFKFFTRIRLYPQGQLMDWAAFFCVVGICVMAGIALHLAVEKPLMDLFRGKTRSRQAKSSPVPAEPLIRDR